MHAMIELVAKVVCVQRVPPFAVDKPPDVLDKQERIVVDLDKPVKEMRAIPPHPDPAPPDFLPNVLAIAEDFLVGLWRHSQWVKALVEVSGHVDRDDVRRQVGPRWGPLRMVDEELDHVASRAPSCHDLAIPTRPKAPLLDLGLIEVVRPLMFWVGPDKRHHTVYSVRARVLWSFVLPSPGSSRQNGMGGITCCPPSCSPVASPALRRSRHHVSPTVWRKNGWVHLMLHGPRWAVEVERRHMKVQMGQESKDKDNGEQNQQR
mmetsp:Transcript_6103/g.18302  ORF Transcript_6103/g.18302 Transcript_6103/m.18302 type:complete len:262 (+) Transcript_6103:3215-4000(+)